MKAPEIINEILKLTKNQNQVFDRNVYTFKYSGNIKTEEDYVKLSSNPAITIFGQENISKYNELFLDLIKELKQQNNISLKSFMEKTQNLIFENKFCLDEIQNIIKNFKEEEVIYITKLYGVSIRTESITYGKFTFVRRDKIASFITENGYLNNIKSNDLFLQEFESKRDENFNFVYIVIKDKSFDLNLSKIKYDEMLKHDVNIIRYITAIKNNRSYINYIPFNTYLSNDFILGLDGSATINSSIHFKDIPIFIDEPYVNNNKNGNFVLWELLSKEDSNEFEKRILEAASWVGISLEEMDINLIIAEIAFAFETLLHKDDETYVSKSITATLSESYAFINGKTLEERIELSKQFKNFYKKRSTIAHGSRLNKNNDSSYNDYYKMIYKTITNILINDDFRQCKNLDDLYKTIEKKRYS